MKTLSYRVIRNQPGEFEEVLSREGSVILNKNGQPLALVLDAASESIETLIRLASQIRAQLAVSNMRTSSRQLGLDRLSPEEIRAEIEAVRAERAG